MQIKPATLSDIANINRQIPEFDEPLTAQQIEQRIGKRRALPLVATIDGKAVGFKLGYALDTSTFYSWIGGVIPSARQHGVADALMRYQEDWTREQGYQRLQVKSMNQYPAMLHFLIARNYKVIGFNEDSRKILFEKLLLAEANHDKHSD